METLPTRAEQLEDEIRVYDDLIKDDNQAIDKLKNDIKFKNKRKKVALEELEELKKAK